MKTMRKPIAVLLICLLLQGCIQIQIGDTSPTKNILPIPVPVGPEVGSWHAVYRLSDIDGSSLAEEDRLILTMLAGDTMFEIDLTFSEDGSFYYQMNTDQMKEAISQSLGTIIGFFIGFDLSLFVDRLIEAAFREVMKDYQDQISGTYTVNGSDITAVGNSQSLYFRYANDYIVQVEADGSEFIRFSRISS